MKKLLVLVLVAVGFLSGCSEYSEGDKVIALPEYSDLRIGFIEATVVSSSDTNVVIRADNIRGERYIPGYAVGEMKTVPTSILMGLEEGLAVGNARAEFFRDSELSRTINRAARFQSVNFTSLPLKDWIAKADKADLDEWAAAFKAILSMKEAVELHKAEMESLNIKDLAASKGVLLDLFKDVKEKGTPSIAEFTSVLVKKEYVKNGAPMITNTPVHVLKSFFKNFSLIRKGITWDMSQAEAWNEINLAILGTEEALNIALQKGLNAKPSIVEGAYTKVAQSAYQEHLKKEALDLLTKKIIDDKNLSDDELNTALSSHFASINEVDKAFALQAGKDLLKGYRDTQSANLAKQKAAEEAVAAKKSMISKHTKGSWNLKRFNGRVSVTGKATFTKHNNYLKINVHYNPINGYQNSQYNYNGWFNKDGQLIFNCLDIGSSMMGVGPIQCRGSKKYHLSIKGNDFYAPPFAAGELDFTFSK